jgi:hypothetical protein
MQKSSLVHALWPLMALGCASSQADKVNDARMDAVSARADATEHGVDQQAAARKENIEQQADARDKNLSAANQPGEQADKKLVGVSEDRALYQSKVTARLDKLAVRINEAQQKIAVLGTRAPTSLKDQLKTSAEEHDLLKQQIMGLRDLPPTDWDRTTHAIDQQLSSLDERVTHLAKSIDDA